MAAADVERTRSCARQWLARDRSLRTWLITYGAIWALTLGCAAIVAILGRPLSLHVHHLLELRLSPQTNPPPRLSRVLELAARNIPIVSWPLLLGAVGAQRSRLGRLLADWLVLASATANATPVGAAVGAYGVALLPYVTQLPLEWGALAVGAGSWLENRRRAMSFKQCLARFAAVVCLSLCAAVVETAAVPHR
jgi:hypothetical protein